jgi:hypothetical protein
VFVRDEVFQCALACLQRDKFIGHGFVLADMEGNKRLMLPNEQAGTFDALDGKD